MGPAIRNLALVHLERSPEEAARILEGCPSREVAVLLGRAAPAVSARALSRLSPRFAADCFAGLPTEVYPDVLGALSPTAAAALLRHAAEAVREAALAGLPEGSSASIRRALSYPRASAGALASMDVPTLFGDLSVDRAIEELGAHAGSVPDRVLVVDRSRRVLGALRTATLCWAPRDATVGSLSLEVLHPVPADVPVAALAGDHRWEAAPAPVVDRAGAFLGVLNPESVRRVVRRDSARPATELVAAFSELCWFGLSGALAGLTAGSSLSDRARETEPDLG